jgi:hypothetical protein
MSPEEQEPTEDERRAIRTAAFDYMICLQMEDQFTEDDE